MPWYAWVLIAWIATDRMLATVYAAERKSIEYTPGLVLLLWLTGALTVWAIVSLAT